MHLSKLKELTEELIKRDNLLYKLNNELQIRLSELSTKYFELLGRIEQLEGKEIDAIR